MDKMTLDERVAEALDVAGFAIMDVMKKPSKVGYWDIPDLVDALSDLHLRIVDAAEHDLLERVYLAAKAYRDAESAETPRMFVGKELHDLGQALSAAISDLEAARTV